MRLNFSRKYNTIALYTIFVFFICLIIYRFIFTWSDSLALVKSGFKLMAPFIISLFVAYFISPMVNFFANKVLGKVHIKEHRLKSAKAIRVLSIIFSYVIIVGVIIFLLAIIIPQLADSVAEIADKSPAYVNNLLEWASTAQITLGEGRYVIDMDIINRYVEDSLPRTLQQFFNILNQFVPNLLNITKIIASGIINIVFGFIIAVYLLYNKESYLFNTRKMITALLPPHRVKPFLQTVYESHKIFSSFFIGKLIDSLIIGLMCFVIMILAHIPYAMLISVIVGVTNMIPYFGPFIGGGIGIVFLLISSPTKALWFIIVIIALQQFDGNILGPKILGDSTGLTPFWVIFAIILFGGMFGLLGMFVGVPCFAVIKNIFDSTIDRMYRTKVNLDQSLPDETLKL